MKTIWKFHLKEERQQTIAMPIGSRILCVQEQVGLTMWAEVDPSAAKEERCVEIFGTGHDLNEAERTYIGTVMGGPYVWHLYELHHKP